jgi:hypothetical protein
MRFKVTEVIYTKMAHKSKNAEEADYKALLLWPSSEWQGMKPVP